MPQSWQEHWPLPPGAEPDAAGQERDTRLQTLGNLTMLTATLNPSVSDGPWASKRAAIVEHSALRLNQAFRELDRWDEKAIRERSLWLADHVLRLWPGPESATVA